MVTVTRAVRMGTAPLDRQHRGFRRAQEQVFGEAAEAAVGGERDADHGQQGVERVSAPPPTGCVTKASISARWV